MQRSVHRRPRHLTSRVALLLLALAVSLMLAELIVRLVVPQAPSWLAIYRRHPTRPLYALAPNLDVLQSTGETSFRVLTDDRGCRRGDADADPRDLPTCLWLGDSFAFGQGLDYAESFVGIVDSVWSGFAHVNAAVGGYGPVQYRQVLEDHVRERGTPARVVVCSYVGNDFHDCIWSKDVHVQDGMLGTGSGVRRWLQQSSHLYRLVAAVYHRLNTSPDNPYQATTDELAKPAAWNRGSLEQCRAVFAHEFAAMSAMARDHGFEMLCVLLPTREALAARRGGTSSGGLDHELPVREAMQIAVEAGLDCLDASVALARHPPADVFFPLDGHLNRLGAEVVAEAIVSEWPPKGR
jgi:hypothetical protein